MAIYGNTISFCGGGGSNDTLPPLLDGFKATRLEAGLVPPVSNAVAFKDIPDGSKIKLVKGSNISGTVTYGTTTDLNHRIVFDSNEWTRKRFQLENDSSHNNISGSDIDQWLNSTKASGWWTNQSTNTTSPDYANEQGFLYQLGITDEVLAQNFNDININATAKAKVGLPWRVSFSEDIPYTFFKDVTFFDVADYVSLYGNSGNDVLPYNKPQTKAPPQLTLYNVTAKIHPMMEPKPETKVALDADGSYFMFEDVPRITLSADKMPVSRANALAGAVWVYGEHEPKNVNDGTKINLTREEIVLPEEGNTDIPPISYTELERPTSTKTWTAPEDGYYKFVGVAAAGGSGTARRIVGASYNVSGGSGGSGGIVASVFKLKRGESVSLAVASGDVTISYGSETANATHGQGGGSSSSEPDNKVKLGSPGRAGTATGGNLINMNGKYGDLGERLEGNKATIVRGGETVYERHISRGGYAQSTRQEGETVPVDRGTTAYIAVLKGNSSSNKPLNFTTKATKTISMLPSKSKVKLGRYKGKTLIWDKGTTQSGKTVLTTNKETSTNIIPKTFQYDNREPQNPSSTIRQIGNARYLWSNVRQWLNAKGTGWYKSQHTYDTPPTYQNEAGFLTDWDDKDLSVIKQGSWKSFSGVDGNNTLDTITDKIAIIGAGEIVDSFDHSNFVRDKIDWAKSPSDIAINAAYWTRDCTTAISGRVGVVGFRGNIDTGGYAGVQDTGMALMLIAEVNPDTRVSENPDSDGCYTINFEPEFSKQVEKQVQWDNTKDFYARQFTYNPKKQYQTMLEGAIASPNLEPPKPEGQYISQLPSRSKVKLGKVNNTVLKWVVCRDSADQSLRLILDAESVGVIGNKMYDNAEPSNSNADRRNFGNNRYIWSNIRQWLNSNKAAGAWYTAQHSVDAPPDYTNVAGFLHEWTEKEIGALEFATWVTTRAQVDGSGTESFQSRVTLPSSTEMGLVEREGGNRLDIFNNDGDRMTEGYYWLRNPEPSTAYLFRIVRPSGSIYYNVASNKHGVRPLCKPLSNTLVSIEADIEGCYTLV